MSKVLIINVGYYGSTGKIARQIAERAENQGWEYYVAVSATSCPVKDKHIIKIGSTLDFYLHALGTRLFDKHGLYSSFATRRLLRKVDKFKPDIVHLHNIHGYYLNYQILFSYLKELHIPIVWTLHDCWPFTGHCTSFICADCNKWIPQNGGCGNCPNKDKYPKSIFRDNSNQNYQRKKNAFCSTDIRFVAVSDWLQRLAGQSFISKNPILVIRNGVDTDIFKPEGNNIKESIGIRNKIVLLGVATSWSKWKGLQDYHKLADRLSSEYQIVLIGLTETQRKEISANIIGLPKTDSAVELAQYYSMADVLLSLSYSESFGLTPVEAMACGTPSIVYNNTAQPELITPEVGRIVDTGDIDGLCAAIEELVKIGKDNMSAACRQRATEEYDKNKCFGKYVQLYNDLISK